MKNILLGTMLMLGNVLAAGSVESKKALSILDSIAGTKQMFEQNYKIGKGAAGQRLGKQWVHLSGMVLPPFEIRMTSKADPSMAFRLSVDADTIYLDKNGKPLPAGSVLEEEAHSVKNVLTSFQVFVVPKSEFGAPPQDMAQWVDRVDVQLTSEDDDGHGPDVGGEEWAYSISHKLKLPKEVKPLSKEWVVAVNTAIEEANK